MTPPATTAAGRGATANARTAAGRGATVKARPTTPPGHRRTLRRQAAPARPRRISGPIRGRARVAPAPSRSAPAARAFELIRSLPEHSLLDRLVRGRAWIPLLGVMLAGIVAMQVEVLKLGTGVGRWMERAATLQTRNEALQASVASLADDQRIERLAARMGMVMPAPTAVSFLPPDRGGALSRALANIHAPDPTTFIASLPAVTSPASTATQGTTTATTAATSSPSSTGSVSATGGITTTTTGAQTTTGTAVATQPMAQTTAGGTAASSQNTSAPSATAPAAPAQTPATGAAALAPAGNPTATTPSGG